MDRLTFDVAQQLQQFHLGFQCFDAVAAQYIAVVEFGDRFLQTCCQIADDDNCVGHDDNVVVLHLPFVAQSKWYVHCFQWAKLLETVLMCDCCYCWRSLSNDSDAAAAADCCFDNDN